MNKLAEIFKNPGSEYRGAPFWAWNGKLDTKELRRQIRIMHKMGMGGFFMHSRVGLDTAYLSPEWFECVNASIDEAEKLNMKAWLYDEDRWPSGAAGGIVTKNPSYRRRHLFMTQTRKTADIRWNKDTLAVFTAEKKGDAISRIRRLKKGGKIEPLKKNGIYLIFKVQTDELTSWHNGYTYLDTMNPEAVREFIRVTHEAYLKNCGKAFGKSVPGIFTDEPNYGSICAPVNETTLKTAWTPNLPVIFRERYGYDIVAHLPEIFFDVENANISQPRYHYMDCLTFLFTDAFARQIGQWCKKNKIQDTGHVLGEQKLSTQTKVVGSSLRFYQYMQAPGMDILTEHNREYDTAKQVSSVARQFGRKWRLTETYGCTGWDFPFKGHKAIGDWQTALGINMRCQHLSWYTMSGQAKRDYPASMLHQSPWWEIYSKVEDYFARINAVMTRGEEIRDLLVIHPIESMWTMVKAGWIGSDPVNEYDKMLIKLRDTLLGGNIDFDYGDEDILAKHGKVSGAGKAPVLHVGKARYRAVVIPPLKTVRSSTLRILERFKRAGGTVVFAGELPEHVDAKADTSAKQFAASCLRSPSSGNKLLAAVESSARRISITDKDGAEIKSALHLLREDKNAYYLFICNTGHKPSQIKPLLHDPTMVRERKQSYPDVRIRCFSETRGEPLELNPDTGKILAVKSRRNTDELMILTSLPQLGSRIFVIPKKRQASNRFRNKRLQTTQVKTINKKKWDISLSDYNALVLDMPAYRIGKNRWQKPREILLIDHEVREVLGIPRRGKRMVQPWASARVMDPTETLVELRYTFNVKNAPVNEIFLALERPDTAYIKVNGVNVNLDTDCGWWCDQSLRKIPVDPALIKTGVNNIEVSYDYNTEHPGLEIVYLLGNFGTMVKGTDLTITESPNSLIPGDWTKQGLAFYSGSVNYKCVINPSLKANERIFVKIPEYSGTAVRILVNGAPAGVVAWKPDEIEITSLLDKGKNELGLEVFSHRRNSHGPFHNNEKWPRWTGPDQYNICKENRILIYQLVPCGIMKNPQLLIKK